MHVTRASVCWFTLCVLPQTMSTASSVLPLNYAGRVVQVSEGWRTLSWCSSRGSLWPLRALPWLCQWMQRLFTEYSSSQTVLFKLSRSNQDKERWDQSYSGPIGGVLLPCSMLELGTSAADALERLCILAYGTFLIEPSVDSSVLYLHCSRYFICVTAVFTLIFVVWTNQISNWPMITGNRYCWEFSIGCFKAIVVDTYAHCSLLSLAHFQYLTFIHSHSLLYSYDDKFSNV